MKKSVIWLTIVSIFFISATIFAAPVLEQIFYVKGTTLYYPKKYTFRFSLWNDPTSTDEANNMVWSEEKDITLHSPKIRTYLGDTNPLDSVDFSEQLYVQVEKKKKDGTYKLIGKRKKLSVVPYALWSKTVGTSVGDITAVYAGNGLTGGGTENDVTLSVSIPLILSGNNDNAGIIEGINTNSIGYGIYGENENNGNYGILGWDCCGVYGYSAGGFAGFFQGKVYISGDVTINGTLYKSSGSFLIDHPLDPENKYLQHSFVESPDMKNVYDGVVVLDKNGEAVVELPDYFEALNKDFRYQLTPIGKPAPNLYIAEEIKNNRFKIAGGSPGLKVSWQVTGIRHDPYAEAHPIKVEIEKKETERGRYLHPEVYGQPESAGIVPKY